MNEIRRITSDLFHNYLTGSFWLIQMALEMPLSVDSSRSSCLKSPLPSAYVPVTTQHARLSSDLAAPSLRNAPTFKLMLRLVLLRPLSLLPYALCDLHTTVAAIEDVG